MICYKCRLEFDEKLGTVCPNCLTNHVYHDGVLRDIILKDRCPNCGGSLHLEMIWRKVGKRTHQVPKTTCPSCGYIGKL